MTEIRGEPATALTQERRAYSEVRNFQVWPFFRIAMSIIWEIWL